MNEKPEKAEILLQEIEETIGIDKQNYLEDLLFNKKKKNLKDLNLFKIESIADF